jgi:hypothetical protein
MSIFISALPFLEKNISEYHALKKQDGQPSEYSVICLKESGIQSW